MKAFPETFFGVAQQLPIRWKVPGRKMARDLDLRFTASWRNGKNGTAHLGKENIKDVAIDFYHRYPEVSRYLPRWASPVCVFPLPGRNFPSGRRSRTE